MNKKVLVSIFILCLIYACIGIRQNVITPPKKKVWKINPTSTILGERKQYIISGRNLYSAEIIAGLSVTVEKGDITPDGGRLNVYLTMDSLPSPASSDSLGVRIIQVRTLDTLVQFPVKVIGEIPDH